MSTSPPTDVVFFDGVCGLCNGLVDFLLRRDHRARLRFAPLQGGFAATELTKRGGRADDLDTIYLLTRDGRLLTKSRAVLHALAALGGLWPVASLLRVVPRPIADRVYDAVARNRYRVFGKRDSCRIATPEEHARFIES